MRRWTIALAFLAVLSFVSLDCFTSESWAKGGGRSGGGSKGGNSKGSGYKGGSHSKGGDVSVRGHTRKDGTYVKPHMRTAPNSSKQDNYSTKGNVNPYTGKEGTVDPFR